MCGTSLGVLKMGSNRGVEFLREGKHNYICQIPSCQQGRSAIKSTGQKVQLVVWGGVLEKSCFGYE